jgi:isoleucyl-tRNA synthetase
MTDATQTSEKPSYKHTLCLLSKQDAEAVFPQKANLPQREPETLKFWDDRGIYGKIRKTHKGQARFILHDGPPYANGHIHLGTALNKILKDITVRAKALVGQDAPYIPGWDCHGLPIEHKVMQEVRAAKEEIGTFDLRRRCRDYALKFIDIMTEDFKRLGVLGDWANPYRTLDPAFEAHELRLFAKIVEKGMVYRSLKPVYWCPGYETALAEAEVEYLDHTSPSIYVKFPSIDVEDVVGKDCGDPSKPLSVLIWTTTPWTLPANLAIALHPDFQYVVMETGADRMVMARGLADAVAQAAGIENYKLHDVPEGKAFERKRCKHPFLDKESLLILGTHVTLETGSGCVHTAPGHGHEDYLAGLEYSLEIYSPVDAKGRFDSRFPEFEGVPVADANEGIVEILKGKGALLHRGNLSHSYPHDWREKKPVIFRATPQWFVSLERGGLRDRLQEIVKNEVQWIPSWGEDRIAAMLDNRVEWCISRQRAWGVPIPAIHVGEEAILDPEFIRNLCDVVAETGVDVWFETIEGVENEHTAKVRSLVEETLKARGLEGDWNLEKDTLDVWFDSGSTHQAVLNESFDLSFPADLYLEGSDQHRGWFQSSLINSVVACDRAPYKKVLTHGFVVDEKGEKLSKTKGNYREVSEVVQDFGSDILRLWVSSEDFRNDISFSEGILKQRAEAYRRFRNTFRFLLTSLADFEPSLAVPAEELLELDRYEIEKWNELEGQIHKAYDAYEFHRVYHLANAYCTVDLSARYLDILKDRLYTFPRAGLERRSAQTALLVVVKGLAETLSPLLAFTCEEVWQSLRNMKGVEEESVALSSLPEKSPEPDRALLSRWNRLFEIRDGVNAAIEILRKEGVVGSSLQAEVDLWLESAKDYEELNRLNDLPGGSDLKSLLIVSEARCHRGAAPEEAFRPDRLSGVAVKVTKTTGEKCVRCWKYFPSLGSDPAHPEICDRCLQAVNSAS